MWALQPHLCWMRLWLGCLWKRCTEGNTGIWNRICGAVMPNIRERQPKHIDYTHGTDCMMKRWKTMWSFLIMVGAPVWTLLWEQTFTKAAAASWNSPMRDLCDLIFDNVTSSSLNYCRDAKNDVPTEDIAPSSGQTSVGVLGRPIRHLVPSSFPTGAHLFTLAAGRKASEKVLNQNHNGQFKPPPKSPFFFFFPFFFGLRGFVSGPCIRPLSLSLWDKVTLHTCAE